MSRAVEATTANSAANLEGGPQRPFLSCLAKRSGTIFAALLLISGVALAGQGIWIKGKAVLAQVLLERAFDQSLATGQSIKPWSWADTVPVAKISFPRLRHSSIVLGGASGQALAFGPAHLETTPMPGEEGTSVIAAHRDTHFTYLGNVERGDEFLITRRDGKEMRFRVTGKYVAPWDASGIDPARPGKHLALVTCWPLSAMGHGPDRLIVEADRIEETPEAASRIIAEHGF